MTALTLVPDGQPEVTTDLGILSNVLESREPPANFQNVAVCNSSDVHFGPKTIIHGSVTIKQFINSEAEGGAPTESGGHEPEAPPSPLAWKGIKWMHKKWGLSPGAVVTTGALLGATLLVCLLLGLLLHVGPTPEGGDKSVVEAGNENLNKNIPIKTEIDKVLLVAKNLRMVTRQEWLAQPPAGPVDTISTPIPMVIITHTATENCTDQGSCTFHVRFIQTFHIESRSWSDIGYNFLVGGDGAVYEGRGWDKVGAHTKGYNTKSLGVAFIGTFNGLLPPPRQLQAAKLLLEMGVANGKLDKDYKLYGHRQLIPTLSPGDELFNEISTWPHFSTEL